MRSLLEAFCASTEWDAMVGSVSEGPSVHGLIRANRDELAEEIRQFAGECGRVDEIDAALAAIPDAVVGVIVTQDDCGFVDYSFHSDSDSLTSEWEQLEEEEAACSD